MANVACLRLNIVLNSLHQLEGRDASVVLRQFKARQNGPRDDRMFPCTSLLLFTIFRWVSKRLITIDIS